MRDENEIRIEILKIKGWICSLSEDKYMKNNDFMKTVRERYIGKLEALEWVLKNIERRTGNEN